MFAQLLALIEMLLIDGPLVGGRAARRARGLARDRRMRADATAARDCACRGCGARLVDRRAGRCRAPAPSGRSASASTISAIRPTSTASWGIATKQAPLPDRLPRPMAQGRAALQRAHALDFAGAAHRHAGRNRAAGRDAPAAPDAASASLCRPAAVTASSSGFPRRPRCSRSGCPGARCRSRRRASRKSDPALRRPIVRRAGHRSSAGRQPPARC